MSSGRVFRDTGILVKKLKVYGIFFVNIKGIRDTWINFRNMRIQCFLNFGDICHICFRDMGYFSKTSKGYGILGPPSRASRKHRKDQTDS